MSDLHDTRSHFQVEKTFKPDGTQNSSDVELSRFAWGAGQKNPEEYYRSAFLDIAKSNNAEASNKYLADMSEVLAWLEKECHLKPKEAKEQGQQMLHELDGKSGGKKDGMISEQEFVGHYTEEEKQRIDSFLKVAGQDKTLSFEESVQYNFKLGVASVSEARDLAKHAAKDNGDGLIDGKKDSQVTLDEFTAHVRQTWKPYPMPTEPDRDERPRPRQGDSPLLQ